MSAILISYPPTTHRYDFAVTLTVIGILATLLLSSLNKAQNEIEKLVVATELKSMRLSLAEAWIDKNVRNQPINGALLQDSNPMLLMNEKPKNYLGEFAEKPIDRIEVWYFDTTKKRLIYVFNDGEHATYRLSHGNELIKSSPLAIGGLDLVEEVKAVEIDRFYY